MNTIKGITTRHFRQYEVTTTCISCAWSTTGTEADTETKFNEHLATHQEETMQSVTVLVRLVSIQHVFINVDHIVAIKPRYSPIQSGTDILMSGGHVLTFDDLTVPQVADMIEKQIKEAEQAS